MILRLSDIEVDCVIGERDYERECVQRLIVDVELEVSAKAEESDDINDTVDYVELTDIIREELQEAECKLIERAARVVCNACMFMKNVKAATVYVTKSGMTPYLGSATAVCHESID